MFGADTALVMDALQIAGLTAAVSGGAVYLLLRRRKRPAPKPMSEQDSGQTDKLDLEKRVQVLERIATDPSTGLADEIEALRETAPDMVLKDRVQQLERNAP